MPEQPDPRATQDGDLVALARIYDAISWFMKGAAQLRVCNNPAAHAIADRIEECIALSWEHRLDLSHGGNDDQKADPHAMMVEHALMNAAGHALYGLSHAEAAQLAGRAITMFEQRTKRKG